jgi:hypothetical protein
VPIHLSGPFTRKTFWQAADCVAITEVCCWYLNDIASNLWFALQSDVRDVEV